MKPNGARASMSANSSGFIWWWMGITVAPQPSAASAPMTKARPFLARTPTPWLSCTSNRAGWARRDSISRQSER